MPYIYMYIFVHHCACEVELPIIMIISRNENAQEGRLPLHRLVMSSGNNLTGIAVQFATQDQKYATPVQKHIAVFNIKISYYAVHFIPISSKLEFFATCKILKVNCSLNVLVHAGISQEETFYILINLLTWLMSMFAKWQRNCCGNNHDNCTAVPLLKDTL